jgi:hypothetical protein
MIPDLRERTSKYFILCALALSGCASSMEDSCPDLSGSYNDTPTTERLSAVLGLKPAHSIAIESSAGSLLVTAGAAHRTLRSGADYRCEAGGLHLTAPLTSGFDVPALVAEHLDRHYTLQRGPDGALVGTSTDRTRVRFLLPELQSAGKPGPTSRWQAVDRRHVGR